MGTCEFYSMEAENAACCSFKRLAAYAISCYPSSLGRTRGRLLPPGGVWIQLELTLGSQRRHVLMTPAMNLMAVGVHSKDQDHDAAHDASGHGTHGGTFNHVQCDHLITFVQINKQMSLVMISQVWQEVRMGVRWEGTE